MRHFHPVPNHVRHLDRIDWLNKIKSKKHRPSNSDLLHRLHDRELFGEQNIRSSPISSPPIPLPMPDRGGHFRLSQRNGDPRDPINCCPNEPADEGSPPLLSNRSCPVFPANCWSVKHCHRDSALTNVSLTWSDQLCSSSVFDFLNGFQRMTFSSCRGILNSCHPVSGCFVCVRNTRCHNAGSGKFICDSNRYSSIYQTK